MSKSSFSEASLRCKNWIKLGYTDTAISKAKSDMSHFSALDRSSKVCSRSPLSRWRAGCWGAQTQTSSHAEFPEVSWNRQTDVSENSGTPKSSISIGFSITNHLFWGTPIFGNTQIFWFRNVGLLQNPTRLRMRYVYVWDPGIRKFRIASYCNPFCING